MPPSVRYIRARHVATMSVAGVIEDGCLAIAGDRIAAVGPTRDLRPATIDLDIDGLLTPGLVNAHAHLDMTRVTRPPQPKSFQDWLLTTMAAQRDVDLQWRTVSVQAGIGQCLKFGVMRVGDISQSVEIVRPILRDSPLRAISYGECLGLGPRRSRFTRLLADAVRTDQRSERLQLGVSPHAPYTVEPADFAAAIAAAQPLGGFLTTHLAETPDEKAFLENRDGPFSDMYRQLGFNAGSEPAGQRAWDHLLHALFNAGILCAHMNYLSPDEIQLAGAAKARIVWCPRTHAYFGHPPHPWRQLLAAGAIVCIGTDSCASAGDLNVMDDLRLVRQQSPDVAAADLWTLVTTSAARAMEGHQSKQLHPSASLVTGEYADFIAWPTRSVDPLTEVLDTPNLLPSDVWINGRKTSTVQPPSP